MSAGDCGAVSLSGDTTMEFGLELDINGYVTGMRKAADETGKLDAAQKKAAGVTKETGAAAEKASQGIGKVGTEAGKGAEGVNKFTTAAQSSSQRMAEFGTKMQDNGAKMADFGKKATAVTLALGASAVGASKMANDYDREFSKITGLVGIAAEEVEQMKQSTLGLAGATAQAPQDLAKAMFTLQSAGLRGATATDALRVSSELAAGGMGEAGTIAQAMTSILATYASANVDAGQAADFLAATARAGNFESSQLAGGLGKVLPVASTLGIELSDVGGAIALLTRANGNASESITQVAAVMRVLLSPSGEAVNILDDVGLTMSDVKETAAGPGGLVAALEQLYEATDGNDEKFAKMLGSSEAVGAAFQILGADNQTLADTFGAVGDAAGVAKEVFDAAANTESFKTQQGITELKVELIELGTSAAPVVTSALQTLSSTVSGMIDWVTGLPQPVKEVASGLGLMAAAAGPLLLVMGKLGGAVGTLSTAMAANGGLMGGITALTGLTGPMLAVGAAAGVAAVAFMSWRNAAKEAQERADIYSAAVYDTTESNEAFQTALERSNDLLGDQTEALEETSEAMDEAGRRAQGFFDVMDEAGQSDMVERLQDLGVSLRDMSDISMGNGTVEQIERMKSAMDALSAAGVDVYNIDFAMAFQEAGTAAETAAADIEMAAVAQRTMAYEADLFTAAQFRVEKANAVAAGSFTPIADAVAALTAEYNLMHPAITGADYAAEGAEAAFLGLGGAAKQAAVGIDESAEAAEETDKEMSSLEIAVNGLSNEYWTLYQNATSATNAVNDYRTIVEAVVGPQKALDAAVIATSDAFKKLEESQDIQTMRAAGDAIRDQTFAMLENGATSEEAAAFQAEYVESLIEVAENAGLSEEELDALLTTYALIGDAEIAVLAVDADTAQADADLAAVTSAYYSAHIEAVVTAAAEAEAALAQLARDRVAYITAEIGENPYGPADAGSVGGGAALTEPVLNADGVDISGLFTSDFAPTVQHEGGMVGDPTPVWSGQRPLANDERFVLAQTGERVLSRSENARYENDLRGSGPQFQVQQSAGGVSVGGINISIDMSNAPSHVSTEALAEQVVMLAAERFSGELARYR